MEPFEALDKAAQTERLGALAERALEAWDLPAGTLTPLSDSFNTVFARAPQDDSGGPRRAVRVHRSDYRTPTQIAGELRWLRAIARDGAAPVPVPVPTRTGELLVVADAPGVDAPRAVSILGWIPGAPVARGATEDHLRAFGGLAAALHDHAEGLDDASSAGLPVADRLFFHEPDVLHASDRLDSAARDLLDDAIARCEARFAAWRADDARPLAPRHCDLHLWNVHVDDAGALHLLDFDDACLSWAGYDLGIARFYLEAWFEGDRLAALWDAFVAGYAARRPWPIDDDALTDCVIARQLELLNAVLVSRDRHLMAQADDYIVKAAGRLRGWLSR